MYLPYQKVLILFISHELKREPRIKQCEYILNSSSQTQMTNVEMEEENLVIYLYA